METQRPDQELSWSWGHRLRTAQDRSRAMAPPPLSPLATSTPLLHGEFGSYPARGPRFALTLTPQALHIQRLRPKPEARPRGGLVLLAEVSGCCTLRSRSPSDPAAYLCIYTYPRGRRGGRRRATRTFGADGAATYEENRAEVQRWATVLTCLLRGLQLPGNGEITSHLLPRPPRLLLLVNPFGGRGLAWQLCKNHVLPMISEAGLSFNLIQTERQNHARELVQGLSLSEWDGIVTVSGDGLLYEVLNGLLDRPDWEEAMKTPVGILPCGSGNALAGAVNQHGGKAARTDIWFSLSRRASRDRLAASLFLYRRLQYFSSWGCRGGKALRSRGAPATAQEEGRSKDLRGPKGTSRPPLAQQWGLKDTGSPLRWVPKGLPIQALVAKESGTLAKARARGGPPAPSNWASSLQCAKQRSPHLLT